MQVTGGRTGSEAGEPLKRLFSVSGAAVLGSEGGWRVPMGREQFEVSLGIDKTC